MMKLKNPIWFWLIIVFGLINLVDMITALFITKGESNPLFILTGSMWPLLAVKIMLMLLAISVYRSNETPSNMMHFAFILILLMGTFAASTGAYSNIKGIQNPEIVEYAASIPDDVKVTYYVQTVSLIYMLPSLITLLAFYLYEKSRKYIPQ